MQGQDLASGNLTAPVLFALRNVEVKDELLQIIQSEFLEEGSLNRALQLVEAGGGIKEARALAREQVRESRQALRVPSTCLCAIL